MKIGVLFVHGIGEPTPGSHLEAQATSILKGLETDPDVSVRTSCERAPGQSDEICLVKATVTRAKEKPFTTIDFREVYWGDLDEPATLKNQFLFWFWGFSMWAVRRLKTPPNAGAASTDMELPAGADNASKSLLARLQLLALGVFFVPVLFLLIFINYLSKNLRVGAFGPDTIYRFMGDVKLFQQGHWNSRPKPNLAILPPRYAIRRRMVEGLMSMAMADYDRWYVIAHSLGSVIAWNGLNHTEDVLPNFLEKDVWDNSGTLAVSRPGRVLPARMRPRRPSWLTDEHAIDRKELFAKFQGVLTYGSPLDKFAHLWPSMIPVNKDDVFDRQAEWINVYDPLDPVAGELGDDGNWTSFPLRVKDYAYCAGPLILLNHVKYLANYDKDQQSLPAVVGRWVLTGETFAKARKSSALKSKAVEIVDESVRGRRRWLIPSNARRCGWIQFVEWAVLYLLSIYVIIALGLTASLPFSAGQPSPEADGASAQASASTPDPGLVEQMCGQLCGWATSAREAVLAPFAFYPATLIWSLVIALLLCLVLGGMRVVWQNARPTDDRPMDA